MGRTAVTVGLAVSLIPILLRVLPPLAKDAATNERDPNYAITVVGLLLWRPIPVWPPRSPRTMRVIDSAARQWWKSADKRHISGAVADEARPVLEVLDRR